jgi:CubicO group peptidase (beta-lactamase class C family)
VIVQGGRIVLERYVDGFDASSRFHTWSMAKSLTHALVGILVRRGTLGLDEPAPIPSWQSSDDPRSKVTLRHMLNMTSGIGNEDMSKGPTGPGDFVQALLFGDGAKD